MFEPGFKPRQSLEFALFAPGYWLCELRQVAAFSSVCHIVPSFITHSPLLNGDDRFGLAGCGRDEKQTE